MEEYEEWHKKRYEINPMAFDDPSQEEEDRLWNLLSGCALRKGSKHRRRRASLLHSKNDGKG